MVVAKGVTKRGLPRTAARWVNGAAEPNPQPGEAVAAKAGAPIPQPIADLPPGMDALRDKNGTLFISSTDGARNYLVGAGGSRVPSFNLALFQRVLATAPCIDPSDPMTQARTTAAVFAALAAFKPADEIEGMIAAQAVSLHHAAMECFRRAILPDQPSEIASKLRKDGANAARAMTDMLDALDRKRGKGPQVVRVERVVVHEGGQAVVGNVKAGDAAPAAAASELA